MAFSIQKGTVLHQLPVTPMVDLVFNLLLFFIVATKFAEEGGDVGMMLPVASEAQALAAGPSELSLAIDRQGLYSISGKSLSLGEMEQVLRAAWVNNPDQVSVIIRADERCPWKYVVLAMNACSKAKIHDYRVTTRERAGGK